LHSPHHVAGTEGRPPELHDTARCADA